MNFATDYTTAYRLLRSGTVEKSTVAEAINTNNWDAVRLVQLRGVNAFSRIRAVFYAVRLAKEMRRQRILVQSLYNIEPQPSREKDRASVVLFPITVHRTVVQMRDPDRGSND